MAQATANFAAFFDGDSYKGRENRDTLELTGGAGDGGFHGVPCEVPRIIGHGTSDPVNSPRTVEIIRGRMLKSAPLWSGSIRPVAS